ncbi:PotD/PotF family extracellular solute-binding protein [Acuticoccus sp. I52.16.1]|uniref:ABC transporter substrate-binding protein n=1 Tax=Acuticoccus sp. I52.16.1 TaxID=2928472 RepID=UPI001FD189C2|nr:PotD/PotF family extracellular solute-binding protein [Acuticoccus sp. I52.16.1]UOM32707.1 PotD/PotF family extracellular solute-binding protein [Acuticoccus sp. I52.16.1]
MTFSRRTALKGGAALVGTLAAPSILSAQTPSELIVRAWGGAWGDALKSGVADPFTAKTGIPVRLDFTEDNEIKPKIWAAVDQGRVPPIHVNWDTTTNATISALRGVTVDLSDLSNLEGLLPSAKPVGLEGWPLVNTYAYVYVCAYRPEAFPDGPPTSWKVMLDPKFKGRVALYDDGIGFNPISVIAGGGTFADIPDNMEPGYEFYRKLKANEPLLGEDPDFTSWFQNGEIDLACTISVNARAAKQSGIAVEWTVPEEGCKVDTDGLWIPKGLPADEEAAAKEFVDYALSEPAQKAWCGALGLPPVRPGIEPPADLAGDPSYPTTPADFEKLVSVPSPVLVENQPIWFAKFNEIFQG